MKRKSKCPCGTHYSRYMAIKEDAAGVPRHSMHNIPNDEFRSIYDPTCQDCREAYKWPGNDSLFELPWWRRHYSFNKWMFSGGTYPWRKHTVWVYKNKGLWQAIKQIFWSQSHYDQYQTLSIPFITVNWAPLEFSDIQDGWIDLSHYYEAEPYKYKEGSPKQKWMTEEWFKQQEENNVYVKHMIKVAYRYQRMWEKQLKEKLNCVEGRYVKDDYDKCAFGTWGCKFEHKVRFKDGVECHVDEWWPVTCERGTYGCAHHPKMEE
jgi:hypothetical protein